MNGGGAGHYSGPQAGGSIHCQLCGFPMVSSLQQGYQGNYCRCNHVTHQSGVNYPMSVPSYIMDLQRKMDVIISMLTEMKNEQK